MNAVKKSPATSFLDSNIWLYAFTKTPEKEHKRKRRLAKKTIGESNVVISGQVINETCVNLIKKADLSEEAIQALISSFYGKYSVVEIEKNVLIHASQLREKYSFAFWDSIIVSAALSAGCKTLYSEDMQDGLEIEGSLRIVNPFRSS